MIVNRKLMRKFTYVSVGEHIMGSVTVTKVTSEEMPDWKVFDFEHEETVRVENTGDYEGYVETTTKRVIDFPKYGEAFLSYVEVQKNHRYTEGAWRVEEELSNGNKFFNGEFVRASDENA